MANILVMATIKKKELIVRIIREKDIAVAKDLLQKCFVRKLVTSVSDS